MIYIDCLTNIKEKYSSLHTHTHTRRAFLNANSSVRNCKFTVIILIALFTCEVGQHLHFMLCRSEKQQCILPMRSNPSAFTPLWDVWEQHQDEGVNVPCHTQSFSMGARNERRTHTDATSCTATESSG